MIQILRNSMRKSLKLYRLIICGYYIFLMVFINPKASYFREPEKERVRKAFKCHGFPEVKQWPTKENIQERCLVGPLNPQLILYIPTSILHSTNVLQSNNSAICLAQTAFIKAVMIPLATKGFDAAEIVTDNLNSVLESYLCFLSFLPDLLTFQECWFLCAIFRYNDLKLHMV